MLRRRSDGPRRGCEIRTLVLPLSLALLLVLLPAPASASWEREVRDAVVRAGFPDLADRAVRATRGAVLVDRTVLRRSPTALGVSRFGGLPDMPVGEPWPQCAGRAQSFLAQVRVRDLPVSAGVLRRVGGLLLVFSDIEFEDPTDTGYGLAAGRCTTIVRAPRGTRLARRALPRMPQLRLRSARMRFTARPDIPDTRADEPRLYAPMRDVHVARDRHQAWWSVRDQLLGRANRAHKLLGHLEQVNGESGRCYWRTQRAAGAWRHLITVGWDERLGFEIADGGRLQIVISPSDLARGRFEDVCAIFDSA